MNNQQCATTMSSYSYFTNYSESHFYHTTASACYAQAFFTGSALKPPAHKATHHKTIQHKVIQFNRCLLQLSFGETCVKIDPLHAKVLLCLVNNQGRAVSRKELIEQVWQSHYTSDDAINRAVSSLRKALNRLLSADNTSIIKTISKVGYLWSLPEQFEFEIDTL